MLPVLTALVVGAGQTIALRSHLDVLAPIAAELPARGGNTGGFWGLTRGVAVVVIGGVLVLGRGWAGLGLHESIPDLGVVVGLLLIAAGWLVLAIRLDYHDHPHVHPSVSHEHIHAHRGGSQIHDHDRPGFGMARSVVTAGNLAAAVPALALEVTPALLYLVTYLAATTTSMAVFGYWLGASKRRGDDSGWVARGQSAVAGAALVVGALWVIERWPLG